MKDAITFVKHAIINRTFDEAVTELHACNGTLQSNNGIVVMSHPWPVSFKFSVTSSKLVKAFEVTNYTPHIKLTDFNLVLTSGTFRARLPYNKEYTEVLPEKGKKCKIKQPLIPALKQLFPFISEDASRTWSQSIMAEDHYLYVTNNMIIARTKTPLPNIVLPIQLVAVMLKIEVEPKKLVIGEKTITAHYNNKAWIQCRKLTEPWPMVKGIFKGYKAEKIPPVPDSFKDALVLIKDFVDDDVLDIRKSTLSTTLGSIKNVGVSDCRLSFVNAQRISGIFTHVSFGSYPSPMYMRGDNIQGVLAGVS